MFHSLRIAMSDSRSYLQGTSSVVSLRGVGSDVIRVVPEKGINVVVRIALLHNFGFTYR